jgi:2',3'-cyclic-nucleotide 2'-phosphodiesterase (5'-nucleotidase family)
MIINKVKMKKLLLSLRGVLFLFILVGLILPFIPGCDQTKTGPVDSKEIRIILFHINDVHGQIDNFARIAWVVEQEKKKNPRAAVFFLNAGDNFSGNPVVDHYEPKGEPILQLMNRMRFDVMVLGNHEFDYGQEVLKSFMERANFPIICANANLKKQKESFPQTPPFTILKTPTGIKIAILGLLQVDPYTGIPATHPVHLQGFTFSDPIATAKKYRYLKKESDIFFALTHLGSRADEVLAQEIKELDLIIGGHSHSQVHHPTDTEINGPLVAQAGGDAQYLGRIELIWQKGQLVEKSGELIEVASIKGEILELKKMIAAFNNNPVLNQVITTLSRPVEGIVEVGNLTCDAIRKYFKLDIVFHNSGGIRVNRLAPTIRLKDIYELHPFENRVVRFKMSPLEIRSLIKSEYERHKRLDLLVSGMGYIVKATSAGEVKAVELKDEKGQLLDETKTYTVGMNDYMSSTIKFSHQDPGKSLMVTVNDALIQYLQQEKDACKGIEKPRMLVINIDNSDSNEKSKESIKTIKRRINHGTTIF